MTNFQYLNKAHRVTGYSWRILRRCEHNLHRWAEDLCNYPDSRIDPEHWLGLARETAAKFGLKVFHQQDCRGCALYVYSEDEMQGSRYPIEQVYNTRATAIC
jgi:hypothetical protein